jgi:hypothetical protein
MELVNWLEANGVVLGLILAALGAIPGWLVFIRKPAAAAREPASQPPAILAAILLALLVSGIALIVIALVGLPGSAST